MAELRGSSTIGGYMALHSGMAAAFLGGTLTVSGNITMGGGSKIIQGSGNGLVIEDTDGTSGTRVWRFDGNANAMKLQALNDDGVTWVRDIAQFFHNGTVYMGTPSYTTSRLNVGGEIFADGWLRTSGATGWYSQTYGGGWYMVDTASIRNYNNKPLFMIGANVVVGSNAQWVTGDGTLSLGNTAVNSTPTTSNWTSGHTAGGATLLLSGLDYTSIGFHDAGARVDFIRTGAGTIEIGYNGGWGNANVKIPGILQATGKMIIPVGTDLY